jgi:hypothetical protein
MTLHGVVRATRAGKWKPQLRNQQTTEDARIYGETARLSQLKGAEGRQNEVKAWDCAGR